MGQRNMICTGQMIDLEMSEQVQGYHCPEPCFLLGGRTNFPQANVVHTISGASGSTSHHDVRNIPEHYESAIFYERMQYNSLQDHHAAVNLELGVATASNFYNSYFTPASGAALLPIPLNQGSPDQLPSSSNYGVMGVSSDGYGRNSHFMDGGVVGSCKRKNAEGFPGNFQYYNGSASSSSSVVPLNARHADGVAVMDALSLPLPQYRGNSTVSIVETGSQRSVRNRSGATGLDPVQVQTHNPLTQGNYIGQPFQPANIHWLDQQSGRNCDGGASAWTQPPAVTFMHGSNVNVGFMDTGNMGIQRYYETATGNRISSSLLNPPAINHQHYIHHPPPHMQGMRGHNINFYPQVPAASFHAPTNNASRNIMNTSQDGWERDRRHLGAVPPTSFSIYRPHQDGLVHESTMRYRNLPHLRVLPTDQVAMLEGSDFYETSSFIDHHRDMRLDIEDMSYEELLALGERIGNVNNGLTEENITSQLKTRSYKLLATSINLEEAATEEQEADSCIICQADYKNREIIATLNCGHEYHADCLKKWLLVKNVCPICKCEALATETKD